MDFDLIIVGAGLVGASLAAALGTSGLKIALVDAEPATPRHDDAWDSRIYAISPGSRDFLAECGAWARIPVTRIAPVDAMEVHGDARSAELVFSAYDAGLPELCFIVESSAIEQALHETIAQVSDITVFRPVAPAALDFSGANVRLRLADNRDLEARLIVGADGAQSWVRTEAGIEVHSRDYRQQGVVANFSVQCAHAGIARQWFRHDGVLALLPLPGNQVSMVWSTWDERAQHLLAIAAAELECEVAAATEHALGQMRLISQPLAFPLRLARVESLIKPRLALIGDAAHSVHPLAGQGVNLGFQDARQLAGVLRNRGAQDDCGDWQLLRRYARARKEAIAAMQLVTDTLQRLFNNDVAGLKWLRNTGLSLTDRVGPLKKILVEHALG